MNRKEKNGKSDLNGNVAERVKNMFVYGTLRHDKSRGHVLGALEYTEATLPNHKKVSPPTLGFPFIVQDESSEVQGEVYYNVSNDLIRQIDMIEGEGSLYHRIVVEVETEDGKHVKAYTYYPSERLIESYT